MRTQIFVTAVVGSALSLGVMSPAAATTPPDDPNDVEAVDNPVDDNDEEGFDDWGLLGLLGLVGLAGLAGNKRREPDIRTGTGYGYGTSGSTDVRP